MGVEITCQYVEIKCKHWAFCGSNCEDVNAEIPCKYYQTGDGRIDGLCREADRHDITLHKTANHFEYDGDPDGVVIIGRKRIFAEDITYLAVDDGTGKQILIDEREGETMAKELTFGEVGDYVKAFEAVNPNGGKMELFAYAYNPGQNAGKVCPRCGRIYNDFPAISRADSKTEICPECGKREAVEAFEKYTKGATK